jgi:AraC family transcriptional regulator, transcriptional activator of pobA
MLYQLPTYELYAEPRGLSPRDVMHWESIAERSRLHDWEIRPHRHEALLQVLLIESGGAEVWLDGRQTAVNGPAAVTVMPLVAHGFRWSPEVNGCVLTIQAGHVQKLLAHEPSLGEAVLTTRCAPLSPDGHAALSQAIGTLTEEYLSPSPWRTTAIDAALARLMVNLGRTLPSGESDPRAVGGRALAHVRRLRAEIEAHFREQPSMASLAATLGITTTQLNRACHQVLGTPALAVLHARVCLEAQRELAYTTLSVKQIAFSLGFTDASYFSRFFERLTGLTPSEWRGQIGWR